MRVVATLTATALALSLGTAPAHAFEDTLRTHGGFWNWRAFRTMRYDVDGWPFARNDRDRDFQTVDLQTGRVRVDGGGRLETYHLAYDGRDVRVRPSAGVLNAPPRFYALAPYQFIGMPFVLAEAGVAQEDLGYRNVRGRRHEAYRFHFPPGADTPADTFVAYVDDDTRLLALVTFEMNGATFAVTFDEWQTVERLTVPKRLSFHEWTNGDLGARKSTFTVHNAAFDRAAVEPSAFAFP